MALSDDGLLSSHHKEQGRRLYTDMEGSPGSIGNWKKKGQNTAYSVLQMGKHNAFASNSE